jgi:hypothetical protein
VPHPRSIWSFFPVRRGPDVNARAQSSVSHSDLGKKPRDPRSSTLQHLRIVQVSPFHGVNGACNQGEFEVICRPGRKYHAARQNKDAPQRDSDGAQDVWLVRCRRSHLWSGRQDLSRVQGLCRASGPCGCSAKPAPRGDTHCFEFVAVSMVYGPRPGCVESGNLSRRSWPG